MDRQTKKSAWAGAILAGAAMLALSGTAAQAAVVFSDDFGLTTDPATTPSAYGWYARNPNATGTGWAVASAPAVDRPTFQRVLNHPTGSAGFTDVRKQFTPVALTNEGDFLTLSFVNWGSLATTTPSSIINRIGLGNNATIQTADSFGSTDPLANTLAYFLEKDGGVNTATGLLYKKTTDGLTTLGGTVTTLFTPAETVNTSDSTSTTPIKHTWSLTLTKVATGLQIAVTIDSTNFTPFVDTAPITTTFNTVLINDWNTGSPGPSGVQRQFDNLSVTTGVIPEPASLGLLGLAGVVGLARRRRA